MKHVLHNIAYKIKAPVLLSMILASAGICIVSCKKNQEGPTTRVPTVITSEPFGIARTSAALNGFVESDGGSPVTAKGICYNTAPGPRITDNPMPFGAGTGAISATASSLTPNTTYYVRAYATNAIGTAYGNEMTFTTPALTVPVVQTISKVSTATLYATVAEGKTLDDGGFAITAKGLCWSSAHTPTIADNKTTHGGGPGTFADPIPSLAANTTYYIRAYATNSLGVGYGETVTIVLDVEGNVYNSVKIGTKTWTMENMKTTRFNDGVPIQLETSNTVWGNFMTPPSPLYCWYNNDIAHKQVYGAIYNWSVVGTGKLSPPGWHVPTFTDMSEMIHLLDPAARDTVVDLWGTPATFITSFTAGGPLKEIGTAHWQSPNTAATNSTGFTALPGGWRQSIFGNFDYLTTNAGFWTSTPITGDLMYRFILAYGGAYVVTGYDGIKQGYSVRCVKN